jgi:protein phosphatase
MVRSHNEDAILANVACGLAILADGMGGYNAGEVASGMAISLLGGELERAISAVKSAPSRAAKHFVPHQAIAAEIARVNTAIYEAAQSQSQYAGMGTTLVVAVFRDNAMTVAHIGDSRLYRFRDDHLEQLTRDHSLLQEQIDIGMITQEEARRSENKNLVTRALGVDPTVQAEIADFDTLPGDLYLLCSDGLTDMVEDEQIQRTLLALSANLELTATQLVQMANDNGGRDNVSVVLIRVLREFPLARGRIDQLLAWLK